MEKFIECPICSDIYGANETDAHTPKILKCGDTICKECLEKIIKKNNEEEIFKCPICEENIKKEQNIEKYLTNKQIINQINNLFNICELEDKDDFDKKQFTKYKITLLGNCGVGKTSVLKRILNEKIDSYKATIGCEPRVYYVKYKNKKYQLTFIDTAGQERYKALTRSLLRNTDGVLFVFDISDKKSFEDLESWYDLYKEENENVIGLLIGNKCDLKHKVDEKESEKFAKEHGLLYMETSTSSDKNIKKAIAYLLKKIISSKTIFESNYSIDSYFSLKPKKNKKNEKPKKKKCQC